MIKSYPSTMQKFAKCPTILYNEQKNWQPTKTNPKSKKSSVFWLSLGYFGHLEVSGAFYLFLRFQLYFGQFKSLHGYCRRFGAVLVIFLGFGIFGTFVVYFGHFGVLGGHFRCFGVFICFLIF